VEWSCSTNGEKRNAYRLLVEKSNDQWVDNIKINLGEIEWAGGG
jgi:hypothetical protein